MTPGWSIRRLLSALVLAATLPVIGVLAYSVVDAWQAALRQAKDQVRDLATSTAHDLDTVLRDNEALLSRFAARPRIRALDPKHCDPIFADYVVLHPEYTQIGVRDLAGKLICSFRPKSTMRLQARGEPWFEEAVRHDGFHAGDAHLAQPSGRWVSVQTYPIRDDAGKRSGLLVLPMDLVPLQQLLLRDLPKNAVVAVIGRDNKFLMRSADPDKWIGQDAGAPGRTVAARSQGQGFIRVSGADDVERVYAYQTVAASGWLVIAGLPGDIVFAGARQHLARGTVLALAALLLALVLASRISRRIAAPIRTLEQKVRALAEGDLAVRTEEAGPSEIVAVAGEFNRMLDARAAAEAQLRSSEERYRLLFEHSSDAVLLTATDGRILAANPAACSMFDRSEAEICRVGRAGLVDQSDPRLVPAVEERTRTGMLRAELTMIRGDGGRFEGELSSAIFRDDRGEARTSMIIRDVSARKRAEQALQALRDQLRALLESITDGFVALDRNWHYTYVNRRAAEMFGRRPEDLVGRHIWTEFPESEGQPFHLAYERVMRSGVAEHIEEFHPPWKRWFENSIYPSPEGITIIFREVTERKRAQLLQSTEIKLMEMLGTGATLAAILDAIARGIEALSEDTLASILLLDADGIHLRHGAAPSLPETYTRAIDGRPIGPQAGSCGTAAYRNEQVIVTDIAADPLWADYAALALEHGLRACWSTPVRSTAGKVLGTIALYYGETRAPERADFELMERWTHLIGVAIERRRAEEELARQLDELHRWYRVTLDREERVGDLKREADELRGRLGEAARYRSRETP